MKTNFLIGLTGILFAGGLAVAQTPATAPAPSAPPAASPDNMLNLDLSTGGRVVIELRPDKAPNSVERIKVLTRRGFYDGLVFHRVIEGFMAQGGDPKGDGTGGSDLPDLKAEFNDLPHVRGTMAMARSQSPDSANSQFYIILSPSFTLDKKYTIIGRVVSGMGFVDLLEKGEPPANPSKIVKASIGDALPYVMPAPTPAPQPAPPPAAAKPAAPKPAPKAVKKR
ncbi:peptidylprolyl isomerase [Sphingomonas naphthae]|uniref:Peptidyl-prolyl cis-trans isomerase n=1 Tax=Sphingomonas naphthae TaxID=1813468 RepID=A0ABY7TRG3_9SPHN|nr:peptidylprolyl isomerase [Sphingomonas naphthae]WCT75266.1 peptidylprolyl isomerase [Sphingomonas naphthae]